MTTRSWKQRCMMAVGGVAALGLVGVVPGGVVSAGSVPATGHFDRLIGAGDGVNWNVSGWAVDLDTPTSPVTVVTTVDGSTVATTVASGARDDVATRYPAVGAAHGYDINIPIPTVAGSHTVCVYGTNTDGSGASSLFGCKVGHSAGVAAATTTTTGTTTGTTGSTTTTTAAATVDHRAGGHFDRLFGDTASTWTVTGWAADLDTPTTALAVNVYVDGTLAKSATASEARTDVATNFPSFGAAHGFTISMPKPAVGFHFVCVSAVGNGGESFIGCKTGSVA